jgi:CHAT domain-containing protein
MIEVAIEPRQFVAGRDAALAVRFVNAGPGICTDIVFKLELPPQFLLLGGRERIEIAELREGQSETKNVLVQPRTAGDFAVSSTNFSYRNQYDKPVRVPSFRAELAVQPASGAPRRGLDVEYAGRELAMGEWDVLPIRIRNADDAALRSIVVTVSGPVRVAPPGPQVRLGGLGAGQEAEVRFVIFPDASGRHVPVRVGTTYADEFGRTHTQDHPLPIVVTGQEAASREGAGAAAHRQDTILFLAASPRDMDLLRPDEEMNQIQKRLQLGKFRDRFRLEARTAVRVTDIAQALIDCDPQIVHFSGHGERDGSLYVEDESGYSAQVAPKGLAELFGQHAATVRCVIVNACHTMLLAEAMTRHIDHVIAMRSAILDEAAITFSIGFYQGLAGGMTVPDAFKRGRALFWTRPMDESEYDTPVLLTKSSGARPGR